MALKLRKEAVSEDIYRILRTLMSLSYLDKFYLVGGTALSLYLGHRRSVDIDLFTHETFDSRLQAERLEKDFHLLNLIHEEGTVQGYLDDIRIELLSHEYPLLQEPVLIDGIRIAGLQDLVAMKLNAIAGRGSRKDFWDIAALLERYDIGEMLSFFKRKYPAADTWHLMRSLTYFADADNEQAEIYALQDVGWEQVKAKVLDALAQVDL